MEATVVIPFSLFLRAPEMIAKTEKVTKIMLDIHRLAQTEVALEVMCTLFVLFAHPQFCTPSPSSSEVVGWEVSCLASLEEAVAWI